GALDRFDGGLGFVRPSLDLDSRRDHVNRRERALLDQSLVLRELSARQLDRLAFDLLVAQREDQVPVSPFDPGDDLDGALAELTVGKIEPLLGDLDLSPGLVDPAVAKERLRKFDAQARDELGVERVEQILVRRATLIEDRLRSPALPRQTL